MWIVINITKRGHHEINNKAVSATNKLIKKQRFHLTILLSVEMKSQIHKFKKSLNVDMFQ